MRWQKKRWSSNSTLRSTDSSGILQCFRGTTVCAARGGLDMHVPEPFLQTKTKPFTCDASNTITRYNVRSLEYNTSRSRCIPAAQVRGGGNPSRPPGRGLSVCLRSSMSDLVRDRTPVTGELVEWLPLLTEPGSPLRGGLQYVVRFAPLLPPAMADTPTAHCSRLWVYFQDFSPCNLFATRQQVRHTVTGSAGLEHQQTSINVY